MRLAGDVLAIAANELRRVRGEVVWLRLLEWEIDRVVTGVSVESDGVRIRDVLDAVRRRVLTEQLSATQSSELRSPRFLR